ncbi:MAG: excinuclease ABC subunit UvrA [Nitrospirae bacterium]|nr:excinuclease ABC subunit UvrA [Nitrospirota bacterium]
MQNYIKIKGARNNNLKNIDIEIPRGKLIVITGPSGSGKTTLAIDTIFAEGQRRYVESLSAYARQFFTDIDKPDVDYIEGLSPSIAIEQKTIYKGPRSTLGTLTEVYDYLRVLYTRIGTINCPDCKIPAISTDVLDVIEILKELPSGTRLQILSPIIKERKGDHKKELLTMRREGFVRARINGQMVDITEGIELNKNKRHTIEIVIDRLILNTAILRKLQTAIDSALRFSSVVLINLIDQERDIVLSKTLACPNCGRGFMDLNPMMFSFNSESGQCTKCKGIGFEDPNLSVIPCKECNGNRLKKDSLNVLINGLNIGEISKMSISESFIYFSNIEIDIKQQIVAKRICKEITDRLGFLQQVGLDYLTLDRPVSTLSGGEAQRMRLATHIGSSLSGVLYILDEPSIGLHPVDCQRLIKSLKAIRDGGNTVIVVEHDEDTILMSDYIIDMGPGAGMLGGHVVAKGTPTEISEDINSPTGRFLSGIDKITYPMKKRDAKGELIINNAYEHNLKNITVKIPIGVFNTVTGVSGSGKSTLILDILYAAIHNSILGTNNLSPGKHTSISGIEQIDRIVCVDQSPIGRTPRSNPATFTGIYTHIRELFAASLDSKARGFTLSRFSFNVSGGRCETCSGAGYRKYEMHFLPVTRVICDVCNGKRFNPETLNIKYKGKSIYDVLSMTILEARDFFSAIPKIKMKIDVLLDVGLDYIKLGQNGDTLSGGEAQRIKIARELSRRQISQKTLYILDEPTTGLHFLDVDRLLHIIHRLVDMGNTVIVIEHNLEVIKSSDYITDLGPMGGDKGGYLIAQGSPQEIIKNIDSITGRFLKHKMNH